MQKHTLIPSVNFHLWEPCNMRCKFCFAGFKDVKSTILPKGHLNRGDALDVIDSLGRFGFSKISFAGGEPTLCPWLEDLIEKAKSFSMTTMLITNGSKLSDKYLINMRGNLDWIVLSIDSVNPETNFIAGRKIGNSGIITEEDYRTKLQLIKRLGFRLKINTVVHRYNFSERLTGFIEEIQPERWKIMRMLPIKGQNDKWTNEMCISNEQFHLFIASNLIATQGIETVIEDNDNMSGSYLMIDPAGRFFDNISGRHKYSTAILEVGVEKALSMVHYSKAKFISRGGLYDW